MAAEPAALSRPRRARTRYWVGAWLLWFTLLCILSSLSQPGPQINVAGIDKVQHLLFFMIGGTLLALALAVREQRRRSTIRWQRIALTVLATGAAVGWFDEWHQSFTPGRSGLDVYDWLADVAGSALAGLTARTVYRRTVASQDRT